MNVIILLSIVLSLTFLLLFVIISKRKSIDSFFRPDNYFKGTIFLDGGKPLQYFEKDDKKDDFSPSNLPGKSYKKVQFYLNGNIRHYYWYVHRAESINFADYLGKSAEEWDDDLAVAQDEFWDDNSVNLNRILMIACIIIATIAMIMTFINQASISGTEQKVLSLLEVVGK